MINRWVARVFGAFLTCLHIVVIIALIMLVIAYLVHQQQFTGRPEVAFDPSAVVLVSKLNEFFAKHIFLVYLVGAFIVYVISVGCLATFVAINQNLERLSQAMRAPDFGRDAWDSEPPLR